MYRIFAIILFLVGAVFFASVALPIAGYELNTKSKFTKKDELLTPLSPIAILGASTTDFTHASNWFAGSPTFQDETVSPKIRYYTVSIPKLKIERAAVEIAGDDLSKHLIHYKGTALPGRRGNTVVFGHSMLPQFYNPKNYLSIFSKLPTLEKGDEIIVEYDGITYRYQVSEMIEVSPDKVEVLQQNTAQHSLSLITCVPPGTYLKRLVVHATLMPI